MGAPGQSAEELARIRYDALVRSKPAQWLREQVFEKPRTLTDLLTHAQAECVGWPYATEHELLAALDLSSEAKLPGETGDIFLPFRLHLFGRTQPGLWACVNQACPGGFATVDRSGARDWSFGTVFADKRETCSHEGCGGLVFPLVLCRQCGGEHLQGRHSVQGETRFIKPVGSAPEDEDADTDEEEGEVGDDSADAGAPIPKGDDRLLAPAFAGQIDGVVSLDPLTGAVVAGTGQLVQLVAKENDHLPCARCGQSESATRKLFLPSFMSVPFALSVTAPTVLEALPPSDEKAGSVPFGGRRLLTFTDSRQGTARFAARLQQDAETRWSRSVTFQKALHRLKPSGDQPGLREQLAVLEALPPETRAKMAGLIESVRAQAGGTTSLAVSALVTQMAQEPEMKWLHEQRSEWPGYDEMQRPQTARMMFWREFARRPARQTSLETLGLVALRYPFLTQATTLPPAWQRWRATEREWQDFLKLCIDFVIRANSCVAVDQSLLRWLGTDIRPRSVCGPDEEATVGVIRWPRVAGQGAVPRLGQLVMRAFGLPDDGSARADISGVLAAAWVAIRETGYQANALRPNATGQWQLDLEAVELTVPTQAWICPVSRRILDTTLRGHTPYVPRNRDLSTKAFPATMPKPPIAGGIRLVDGSTADAGELRTWLEESADVRDARNGGAWTEFSDRIVLGQSYFRVSEHSAQIPRRELEKTEKLFKSGSQNILASSTTMEMGIDIGGLSGVAMTNAPPSPSNFLQRAGRAGRRGESRAISLTICRPLPHDSAVFRNPTWPFTTPMYVPSVRFESQSLVQRHVNALCLGHWLTTKQANAIKLSCGMFFCADGASASQAEAFEAALGSGQLLGALQRAIQRLVAGTSLDSKTEPEILVDCAKDIENARLAFTALRAPLLEQMKVYGEAESAEAPFKAMKFALRRLEGEYLLGFLVERQVLPGHGFPTGIVPFNSVTLERIRKEKKENGERAEDNRLEGTSRPLEVALREYAPGVDVVIRGLSYKSSGVLLNWHIPANAQGDQRDVQAIRWLVECGNCEHVDHLSTMPTACPNCGHQNVTVTEFLVPAGFAVDFTEEPSTDLSSRGYVPVPPPRAFAGTATPTRMGRPGLVDFRYSPHGHLTTLCSGLLEHGYALCLHCGRAESEQSRDPKASSPLDDHKALRRGKSVTNAKTGKCTGNDNKWAVKRHLDLGSHRFTDVLELRFLDDFGDAIKDPEVAVTLAFGLRTALAEELGIEESEIGVAEGPKTPSGRMSVFLFDTAAGGAGFCGEAVERLPRLLQTVQANLLRCDCERACHKCLLSFSTQSLVDHLNRVKALAYMTNERLRAVLPTGLPEIAGVELQPLWEDGLDALERLVKRHPAAELRLFAHGAPASVDVATWRPVELLLTLPNVHATLEFPAGVVGKLDWQQALQLSTLVAIRKINVVERAAAPELAGQKVVAEVVLPDRVYAVCIPASAAELGQDWLSPRNSETGFIATSAATLVAGAGTPVPPAALTRAPPAAVRELRFEHQLNGALTTLGARFWKLIQTESPDFLGTGKLREIIYTDRYLTSPASGAIIWRILRWLVENRRTDASTLMRVRTAAIDSNRQQRRSREVSDDFPSVESQTGVLKMMHMPERLGAKCGVEIAAARQDLPHHRSLKVVRADGTTAELRLDQGMGFLKLSGSWDDRLAVPVQADRLVKGTGEVWKQHAHLAVGYLLG